MQPSIVYIITWDAAKARCINNKINCFAETSADKQNVFVWITSIDTFYLLQKNN